MKTYIIQYRLDKGHWVEFDRTRAKVWKESQLSTLKQLKPGAEYRVLEEG